METCHKCGRQEERAAASNPDKGMMWDGIDEKWVCQKCDREKINASLIGSHGVNP